MWRVEVDEMEEASERGFPGRKCRPSTIHDICRATDYLVIQQLIGSRHKMRHELLMVYRIVEQGEVDGLRHRTTFISLRAT